jgi:flagellin
MPQVINTNIFSLNAQRNLNNSQNSLATSLERLSSGLRINSAKDDAAGLAISNRFTTQVRGLNQAIRNANDGVSLAQTAEGALGETNNILQRVRELAIQSANATNSASDRGSLQQEVNQLKQELDRIANTTNFNSQNLLDGSLNNALFQVGSEANETISVSIGDARSTALGANTLSTSNATNGLEAATGSTRVVTDGAEVGAAQPADDNFAAMTNGLTGEVLTVQDADGSTVGSVTVAADAEVSTVATALDAIDGVNASANNQVTLSNYAEAGDNTVIFSIASGATSEALTLTNNSGATDAVVFTELRDAINNNANLAAAGVFAAFDDAGTSLVIANNTGDDLGVTLDTIAGGAGGATTLDVAGLDGVAVSLDGDNAAADTTRSSGQLNVLLASGYTVESDSATQLFNVAGGTSATVVEANLGATSAIDGVNNVANQGNATAAQTLTVVGQAGSDTVDISANATAGAIATAVNSVSASTGVEASAITTATLSGLSADGTVSFSLYGTNSTAASVGATVTQGDLSALVTAINNETGQTGISAALGGSGNSIDLTHADGRDIVIEGFGHSAATAASASDLDGNEASIDFAGAAGTATKLADGGVNNGLSDSATVGGVVTFTSASSFNVTTTATTESAGGNASLFDNAVAGASNTSTLSQVNQVDISTVAGATDALGVIDGAITQVDELRSSLGAVQNRFESTMSRLSVTSENLSAARSRILDADFAAETAALTRAQILQQASISILSQANAQPQLALSLLQ